MLAKEYLSKKIILRSDVFFTNEQASAATRDGRVAGDCQESGHISGADRAHAESLIEQSEEYEESGDFETAAKLYEQAMEILRCDGK